MDNSLREQCMINQFCSVSGCSLEQARKYLQATQWQFESALSMFFQESSVNIQANVSHCRACNGNHSSHYSMCAPANTPATPPQFPDALAAFSKLSATEKFNTPPGSWHTTSPQQTAVSQSPKRIEVGK